MNPMTEAAATYTTTLHLKVRSEAWAWLDQAAREVNAVWNWANATSARAARPFTGKAKWLTGFDLNNLSAGATKCFDRIGADTIQRINGEYASKRRQFKRAKLRWRISTGAKRSLGWVPFKAASLKCTGGGVTFCKKSLRVFEAERLEGVKFGDGSFAQNALGEWFLNVPVKRPVVLDVAPREAVGIDLGLKRVATTSDGAVLDAGTFYRDIEDKIAQAQRRGHKRQAKRYHAKAANRRLDAIHAFTSGIVKNYQRIAVGDVSSLKLAKTRMAKSVLDAGWGMLKTQLQYKGHRAGRSVEIVNERNTTRACFSCGQHTGPSGLRQLVVREWTCECGVTHDRDTNAARNILRLGCEPPFAGTRCQSPSPPSQQPPRCEAVINEDDR